MPTSNPENLKINRRLRGSSLCVTIAIVLLVFVFAEAYQAHSRYQAATHLQAIGGEALYFGPHQREGPGWPDWFRDNLALDLGDFVYAVRMNGVNLDDSDLRCISRLRDLSSLDLSGTNVTDDSLKRLRNLSSLKSLYLASTEVTDSGIEELLPQLPRLSDLDIRGTRVSDKAVSEWQRSHNKLQIWH